MRTHLPNVDLPLTQAQRATRDRAEYGYAGWQDLTAEVGKRLGKGLEWAVAQARRMIHDNDVERLRQLLAESPALLSWKDDDDDCGLLGMATSAYGDAGDAQREQSFTRGEMRRATDRRRRRRDPVGLRGPSPIPRQGAARAVSA